MQLLLGAGRGRDVFGLLHGGSLADALHPLVDGREVGGQVDVQQQRGRAHPREVGDVGQRVLVAGEPVGLGQARLQHAEEALRLVDVPLDAVGRVHGRHGAEVVRLACLGR